MLRTDPRDRPDIEVTEAMIEAGVYAFSYSFGADALSASQVRRVVESIYCAMEAVAPALDAGQCPENCKRQTPP